MSTAKIFQAHQRQLHLDFHTSPHIPGIGSEFDAEAFADTLQRARINSATVFAKCHHGMCYYPTKTGVVHPHLAPGRDLLGEQIEALHRRGIRAPIYTTIVWEEDVAQRFPQWRQLTKDGRFAEWPVGPDGLPGHIATWKFNNPLHPDYQDYFEAHVRELLSRYGKEVDGFFFDILFFEPSACWSEPSIKFREKHGLLADDKPTFERFQGLAQGAFAQKFTKIVHGIRPQATVFYNAGNDGNMHPQVGPRTREPHATHCEIESLPSGFWGYHHFPRMARAQSTWGKPWLGMTGRFQKMWGDFGGIKPQPALEFECFRAQALGGAMSVGDQLPPRGTLDPAAYELIGAVYQQWEYAEPFYAGAKLVSPRVGIFNASHAGLDGGKSEEGAVLMCEEAHYDCAVLDGQSDLRGYSLLILPDSTVVSPALVKKLAAFHAAGGKLLLSGRAGHDEQGRWALPFLPLTFHGEVEKYPTYWRARPAFDHALSASDRVFYQPGLNVKPGKGAKVLVDRVLPYFKRSAIAYSSHFQTPPVAAADRFPAVVAGEGFVYFADPIFREYRQAGNVTARDVWRRCVRDLVGPAPFGEGLPTTVNVYPLRRGRDLLLTLLHYVPIRKAMDIDVIEERGQFAGEFLRLADAGPKTRARLFGSGEELPREADGSFRLPLAKGRLLIEVPGYFAA
jgi:hypothetical protein